MLNKAISEPKFDVICIGRSSVDLYGSQVGGRLEDMAGFAKYIGGSPTNISIGAARLGLKSAVITRVGNEHMGRFICEQLVAEGVDVSGVITDPVRLTALVLLGIRDNEQFPLIFYRENCADMGLVEDEIDPAFIASARAVLVTGTHFSTPQVAAASMKAIRLAREAGRKVAFDIDYRPNLWALGGHNDGESRFVESAYVTEHLKPILSECDLIVGTEEEWHIAGGSTDTLAALASVRAFSDATMVCKRGALGCTVFAGKDDNVDADEPVQITSWNAGITVPVQKIEVFNVLGAGDGFMAGFLRGWLRNESLSTAASYANGCGALAVSRHGCAPAYPSFEELSHLLTNGSLEFALRKDAKLSQLHWATTRRRRWHKLAAFAFDHRHQFIAMAKKHGRNEAAIDDFKSLALGAASRVMREAGDEGAQTMGILVDDRLGRSALHKASDLDCWIGRPIEESGVFPLSLEETPDIGSRLAQWPANHCVKVLLPYRSDDPIDIVDGHEKLIVQLFDACQQTNHEMLLEIITARPDKPTAGDQVPLIIERMYQLGVFPDWWKLEPVDKPEFWAQCGDVVRAHDPHVQGIIVLGKEAPSNVLATAFAAAKTEPLVKGFAIGRTIFADVADSWFKGELTDDAARDSMANRYRNLVALWDKAGE